MNSAPTAAMIRPQMMFMGVLLGIGTVSGGRFCMVVVTRHQVTPDEWAQWRRAFEKSSESLWDATEAQLAFGNSYMADDATGKDTADIVPSWLRHGP